MARLMAEGPFSARRNPGLGLRIAKRLYRRSIGWRARFPLVESIFTEKERALNLAMQFVAFNRVPGDYLEFGCFEGNSFIAAYHLARAQGLEQMRFYAFDSFRGLPEANAIDVDPVDATQYFPGDFSCDVDAFRRNLRAAGVSFDRVNLVEGYYRDSLTDRLRGQLPIQSAAVVMLDCDLHESTQQALRFVTPYLGTGSVVLFDDWNNFKADPARGQRKAFSEWLEEHRGVGASPFLTFGWHGQSFIIHAASDLA